MPEQPSQKPLPTLVVEFKDMAIAYAKQETIEPLRNLGRFIAFGLAGTSILGVGVVLLAVAILRVLQEETGDTFAGNWSWAPYLITLVFVAVIAMVAARAIGAARRRKETRP